MTTITIDKELLEQVVNKLLTCWPKSDPLVNELRAALAAPATAPARPGTSRPRPRPTSPKPAAAACAGTVRTAPITTAPAAWPPP